MKRPLLTKDISLADFDDFYWLKKELSVFCASIGISNTGGKMEIQERIRSYLSSGVIIPQRTSRKKVKSAFDWNIEPLSVSTIITDSYANTENVRHFFTEAIGKHFSFNVKFMSWMKESSGKSLDEAIAEWKRIQALKKDKTYQTSIAPQFEYNRYIRAFLADHPLLTIKDAINFWKRKKVQRGSNAYEPEDLKLFRNK